MLSLREVISFLFMLIGRVISKHGHPKDYAIAFEFAEAALEICKDGIQKAKLLVFMNQLMVRLLIAIYF